ncbi:hypothetical protein [Paenibacillus thiaminolyticus]|uniref:hypothetical protein n=1 Tax=Paenibacillus thiaminolyticus TaxID=49283 RepID=UPI0011C3E590|nr:hypothetical protein [Paenibacillus thiaminolyticus]
MDEEHLHLAVPAGRWMHYGGAAASMGRAYVLYGYYGEVIPDITRAIITAAIIRGVTHSATTGRSTG